MSLFSADVTDITILRKLYDLQIQLVEEKRRADVAEEKRHVAEEKRHVAEEKRHVAEEKLRYEQLVSKLDRAKSIGEVLHLRNVLEEAARKYAEKNNLPGLNVTDALGRISKEPEVRECVQAAFGGPAKTGEASIDKIFAGLYPLVSRTVHEYVQDFKLSHPGLNQHQALRQHVSVVRCIANAFDIPMIAEDPENPE
jgi:hypothetical protein